MFLLALAHQVVPDQIQRAVKLVVVVVVVVVTVFRQVYHLGM